MAKAPRKTVDPNETKRQKFERLAKLRVTNAIKAIDNLAKLGTKAYDYEEFHVVKACGAIAERLEVTEERLKANLSGGSSEKTDVFTFDAPEGDN